MAQPCTHKGSNLKSISICLKQANVPASNRNKNIFCGPSVQVVHKYLAHSPKNTTIGNEQLNYKANIQKNKNITHL